MKKRYFIYRVSAFLGFAAVILFAQGCRKKVIPVEEVLLNETALTLQVGESLLLNATVLPEEATDQQVIWSVEDNSIATVQEGLVKAVGTGQTLVFALAGKKTVSCAVTVIIKVTSVTLEKTSLELVEGETESLVAVVLPEDATDKTLHWTSSAPDIVTVDDTGKVTAVKAGSAIVQAEAGGFKAECSVTILEKDPGYGGFNNEKKW